MKTGRRLVFTQYTYAAHTRTHTVLFARAEAAHAAENGITKRKSPENAVRYVNSLLLEYRSVSCA